ncbi:hypothetical protein AAG570_012518 [Ranatra chinensis]|uniref:Uncharacterized protein n=1 Tax=Ranatra chinensis TaxID=642074 RepID=A0ABD0YE35_9HEMI
MDGDSTSFETKVREARVARGQANSGPANEYRKEGEGPGAFATRIADAFRSVKKKILEAKVDEGVTSRKTTAAVLWKLVREVIRRNMPERVRGALQGLPKEMEPEQLVEPVLKEHGPFLRSMGRS